MQVQIWNAFSCNNSGAHYLVARFAGPAKAQEVADELRQFFAAHAEQSEHRNEPLTLAMVELGIKYGFEWDQGEMDWAEDWDADEEEVRLLTDKDRLLVYHHYCLGVQGVIPYLKAVGGSEISEGWGEPPVALLFDTQDSEQGRAAYQALESYFAGDPRAEVAPWGSGLDHEGDAFWWGDGQVGGFYARFSHEQFEPLKAYFAGPAFSAFRMLLGDSDLRRKLRMLSDSPLCPACGQVLSLLEAGMGVPVDHATCRSCGGMYELADLQHTSGVSRLGKGHVVSLAAHGAKVFAMVAHQGIYRLASNRRWQRVREPLGFTGCLLVTRAGDLLAVSYGKPVLRSRDGGDSFEEIGGEARDILSLTETDDGTLFASTWQGGTMLRSNDGGASWHSVQCPGRSRIMSVSAASNKRVYACRQNGNILRLHRKGKHLDEIKLPNQEQLNCILTLTPEPDGERLHALCVGNEGRILTTLDGEDWQAHRFGQDNIRAVAQGNDGRLYAVTSAGDLLISCEGQHWEARASGVRDSLEAIRTTPEGRLLASGANGVVVQIAGVDSALSQQAD